MTIAATSPGCTRDRTLNEETFWGDIARFVRAESIEKRIILYFDLSARLRGGLDGLQVVLPSMV